MQSKALSTPLQMGKIFNEAVIALLGSIFLIALSQLAIPLPFTPIPLTLQTLGVFLLGGALGGKRATYSVLTYLIQGCCGLPVFAGGMANPLWFITPRAGFLLSFIVAAFLIGKLLEKKQGHSLLRIGFALFVGQIVIFGMGMTWLALYVGWSKAYFFGVLPFISGAVVKVISGTLFLKSYHLLKRNKHGTTHPTLPA